MNDKKPEVPVELPIAPERPDTPYTGARSTSIKTNIRRVWERQKESRKLTQGGLASALGLSQGAVSKLLSDEVGHAWTIDKINKFIEYCRIEPVDVFGKEVGAMMGFLTGWDSTATGPAHDLIDECRDALGSFFEKHGRVVSGEKREQMAVKVAYSVKNTDRSAKDFEKAIMDAILEMAGS